MLAGVGGGDLGADASGIAGDDGEEEADGVDAAVEESAGDLLGEFGVAEHDGDDGVLAGLADVEAGIAEAVGVVAGVVG